jgi:dCMP deaminase
VLEHAERNAIFDALLPRNLLKGATMYSTLFPCADCARAIVASGVSRLVVLGVELDLDRDQKWLDHYRHAARIFELAGIVAETINPDELIEANRP